jgi:hypothetical protein
LLLHGKAALGNGMNLSVKPAKDNQTAYDGEDTAVHGFVDFFIVESQIYWVGVEISFLANVF